MFIPGKYDTLLTEIMPQAQPLVSVVIPTYGRSETLVEAVRSVIKQTYTNIELLVVDDASPTPVEKQVSKLPFGSLTAVEFIRHEENRGANVARNSGIDAASGQYVAFLDDDDRWDERKIDRQMAAFRDSDPGTGVVYTGIRYERPNETVVKTPEWRGDVVEDLLAGRNFGQFSSLMVHTDVIEAAGRPDERFPIWQDREWFFRLAQHCRFEPVTEPLTIRKTGHDDQISGNFEGKRDVAYPLFVEKHRSLAAEYGVRYERLFLATLRYSLAKTAIRCQHYSEARKYFLLTFLAYPAYESSFAYLLATIGGGLTYPLIQELNDRVPTLRGVINYNASN
jgi:glycosyltransferase involved in cell wall biosynthesis